MDQSGKMISHININSTKSNETKHFDFMESKEAESLKKMQKYYANNSQNNQEYYEHKCPFAGFNDA